MARDGEGRALLFAALKHLKDSRAAAGEQAKVDEAVSALCAQFGVDIGGAEDVAKLSTGKRLDEVWAAGLEALGVEPGSAAPEAAAEVDPDAAIKATAKFQQYLEKVKEKGFFKGVEEGSAAYMERMAKLLAKYKEKFSQPAAAPAAAPASGNNDAEGDRLKNEGNKLLQERDYEGAAQKYSEAIEVCPTGANAYIYYCNRAAAYINLGKDEEAAEDSAVSATLMPDYSKAHARAAQANQRLGRKEQAVESAKRALELDPTSALAKAVLAECGGASAGAGAAANPLAAMGGPGGLGGMADMMKNMDPAMMEQMRGMAGGMGGGAGGMPDLGSLMSNPMMMQMAQQMMQDPSMMAKAQEMMQNPDAMAQAMKMFGGMGGAGGGI